jgi:hypothetical protein
VVTLRCLRLYPVLAHLFDWICKQTPPIPCARSARDPIPGSPHVPQLLASTNHAVFHPARLASPLAPKRLRPANRRHLWVNLCNPHIPCSKTSTHVPSGYQHVAAVFTYSAPVDLSQARREDPLRAGRVHVHQEHFPLPMPTAANPSGAPSPSQVFWCPGRPVTPVSVENGSRLPARVR